MPEWLMNFLSLLAGSGLALLSGWVSDRRSASRDREARQEQRRQTLRLRRDDFQRETLLRLQDVSVKLANLAFTAMNEDFMAFLEKGEWDKQEKSKSLQEDLRINFVELRLLESRVRDQEVRGIVAELREACNAGVQAEDVGGYLKAAVKLTERLEPLNDRIGLLIRDLDNDE